MAHLTFIHGISNKPAAESLHRIWRDALLRAASPLDLDAEGVTSEMVYWADVLYAAPTPEGELESAAENLEIASSDTEEITVPEAGDPMEQAWIEAMSDRMGVDPKTGEAIIDGEADLDGDGASAGTDTLAGNLERFPIPRFVKDRFMKQFLRDVHHYLFNAEFTPRPGETFMVQDEIRNRFVAALERGAAKSGPHIVISHSMGTVIAYDCLKRVAECPGVDALITLGSPLGIDEVQDKLKPEWSRNEGFPANKIAGEWLNVYDPMDVVSRLDPHLANDYRKSGTDVVVDKRQNHDGWWTHSLDKYFHGEVVSVRLKSMLGL